MPCAKCAWRLLEADVALPVVKDFVAAVKEKAVGQEVIGSLNPGQALIGVVHAELTKIMGDAHEGINFNTQPPAIVLMAGFAGRQTTTVGKLAKFLRKITRRRCWSFPVTFIVQPLSSS